MIPGFFAVTAVAPEPPYPPYVPTPYAIASPRAAVAYDWSTVSGDTSGTVTPDPSWAPTDYVLFAVSTISTTVTPPAGIVLLAQYQSTSDSNMWQRVYGSFRGVAASWVWTFSPGGTFAIAASAIAGVDSVTPYRDSSFATFSAAGNRRHVRGPDLSSPSTDGLYSVSVYTGNINSAGSEYKPGSPLPLVGGAFTSFSPVRATRVGHVPVAEGITRSSSPWLEPNSSTPQAIGGLVTLNRAPGVRPTLVPDFSQIESYLASFSVGYAWIALKDGVIVESNAAGYARDAEAPSNPNVPFTLGTRIAVASISKVLTEIAIRKLVELGMISLDDTLSSRLTGYAFGTGVGAITIRQLLQMTSGIASSYNLTGPHPATMSGWLSNSTTNPGQWYEYQNGNFAPLQEVISQVTGVAYATWVQANVLDLLDIAAATTSPDPNGPLMYRSSGGIAPAVPLAVPATAVAGWQMTCDDMAKLSRACRYPIVLTEPALGEMLNDRYRMSRTYGPRGEMHQHDGALIDTNNRGLRAQLLRGTDGYDIVAVTNTYDTSGVNILPAAKACLASI